jgi:hypothetical protein
MDGCVCVEFPAELDSLPLPIPWRNNVRKFLLLSLLVSAVWSYAQEPVPSNFFGMDLHCCAINGTAKAKEPWPSVPLGSIRLWDSATMWFQLNPSPGVYNWEVLDSWLDHAEAHHQEVIYTFGGIPTWASGDRNDPKCKSWNTPGSCHPPADISDSGSGSNQAFKDFVTAIARHAHGRIKYWEVWNEPHNLFFWHGSMEQMVRMTQDLRSIVKGIDPDAVIISPGTGWDDPHPETGKSDWNGTIWTDRYLAAGGKKYIDVVATHAYLHGQCPTGYFDSDQIAVRAKNFHEIMKRNGIGDMPLWSTEGSWGPVSKFCTADPDMQVAFVGQYHIAIWAAGIKRVYWYSWNDSTGVGVLWDQSERPPHAGENYGKMFNGIRPAGTAYGEVSQWMVGATSSGCSKNKSQTSCPFTRPDGSEYLALWDSAQTCAQGSCTTTTAKVDPMYVDYLDLAGGKTKIQNSTVPVGLKPIWLEAPGGSKRK